MNNRFKNRLKTKKGFTLAEVLITLAIIGVIAALTIPSLITNIQEQQYKTAWKKVYSELDQANKRILVDNGGNIKGVFSSQDIFKDAYLKYLSYTSKCNYNVNPENCWHPLDGSYKYMNGGNITGIDPGAAGAILNNGYLVRFYNYPNCDYGRSAYSSCGHFWVDVNGWKGPNIIGKDIFGAFLLENGLKPYGVQGDSYANSCSSSSSGWSCSAQYLMQ